MSLNHSLLLVGQLVSIGLFLSGAEFLRLSSREIVHRIWSPEILALEFERSLPAPRFIRSWFSSEGSLRQLALAEMILAVAALISPSAGLFASLTLVHLLLCMRFRGTFNGGSDQMFLQTLMALTFGFWFHTSGLAELALIYLTIQIVYSYFKAGWVKLLSPDWRSGVALTAFLQAGPFTSSEVWAHRLKKSGLAKPSAWIVIGAELMMPLSVLHHGLAVAGCAFALVFHLLNARFFGLNRFFWAWLSAWPAVFYFSNLR